MELIKELTKENRKKIKEILDKDGVIIFPTDTVYGIGCNCYSEKAIKRIFEIKNRPNNKPISVLTNSYEKIETVAIINQRKERELIEKYMPGDLTIILEKKESVPNILTANLKTIGVRIPKQDIALTILEDYPYPLAVTSVNESGQSPGIEVNDFLEEFQKKVDLIVDGGRCTIGISSTIIKVENDSIKILREGHLKVE